MVAATNMAVTSNPAARAAANPGNARAARQAVGMYANPTVSAATAMQRNNPAVPAGTASRPAPLVNQMVSQQYPWMNSSQLAATGQAVQPYVQQARQAAIQQLNQTDPTVMQGLRQQARQEAQASGVLANLRQDARQDARQQMLAAGQAVDPAALKLAAQQAAQQYVRQEARQDIRPFLTQQVVPQVMQALPEQTAQYLNQVVPQIQDATQYYNPIAQLPATVQGLYRPIAGLSGTPTNMPTQATPQDLAFLQRLQAFQGGGATPVTQTFAPAGQQASYAPTIDRSSLMSFLGRMFPQRYQGVGV